MSNVEAGDAYSGEISAPPSPEVQTAGKMIRAAREAAGISMMALAVSMKVPVRKLEALEADRPDVLLDMVFVRALASSVCRTLKVDAGPILALLPPTAKPSFEPHSRAINAPFKVPGEFRSAGVLGYLKHPALLTALALLAAACAIFFVPELNFQWSLPEQSNVISASPVAVEPDAAAQTTERLTEVLQSPPVVNEIPGAPAPEPSAAKNAGLLKQDAVAVPTVVELLGIKANGASWVEVVDVNGAVLVRKLMQPDETVSVNSNVTVSVVIGRADMVDVRVRGKAFSMTNISKDNVARFEVK